MATEGGPKIERDGLELHLDTSTPKSFPGESTENLVPSGQRTCSSNFTRRGYHVEQWFYALETNVFDRADATKIYITPTGNNSQPYADWGFTAHKSGGSQVGDVYTVSFDYKVTKNTTVPSLAVVYANGYKSPTSAGAASLSNETHTPLGDGWTRFSETATITTAGNTWWRFGMSSNNNETEVYVDNFQIELKSYRTPFVDGTRGTTVATGGGWRDRSGNSRHGELKNGLIGTYTDRKSRVLEFDGSSDYIDFGSDITISPANQGWTAIYVFNTDSASTLQHFNSAEADDFNANWLAILSSYLAVWDHGQGTWRYGSTQFSSNTWYHVAFVQTSGTTMQFYVNGEPESGNHTSFSFSSGYSALKTRYVGRYEYNGGYSRYFNGKIPVVQMYSRALTASEIKSNFNSIRGRFGL